MPSSLHAALTGNAEGAELIGGMHLGKVNGYVGVVREERGAGGVGVGGWVGDETCN